MTINDSQSSPNSTSARKVRKAVLPAAGLGTRFLPATKAQPKEMLAVVDKPQIQYVAEECVASGIEHIIIVTGRGKSSIEDHFDASPFLEDFLEKHGKKQQAKLVRDIADMVQVSYTRQKEPLGLGHAVLVARDLVGDEPFAVLLGDVLIPGENPATKQLIEVYEATGVGAIAVEEVPKDRTHLYGIVAGEPAPQPPFGARLLRTGLYAEALTCITAHQRAHAHLVLLSASPDLYVPILAKALGFDECACSQLRWRGDDRLEGTLTSPNRRGAEKTRYVEALLAERKPRYSHAYGNSRADLEHLRLVSAGTYVNGSARDLAGMPNVRAVRWHHRAQPQDTSALR